jgi:hypothetical protein
MLSDVAGLALLAMATLSVMRAGAKMGSGPSISKLEGAVLLLVGDAAVVTAACVPVVSHVSVRAAIGLAELPDAEVLGVFPL